MNNNKLGIPQNFEWDENWKTGTECPETGWYICDMHPYVEKWVVEGKVFPKCDQKGLPHSTTWNKLVK